MENIKDGPIDEIGIKIEFCVVRWIDLCVVNAGPQ
jgi:hypothetical protein